MAKRRKLSSRDRRLKRRQTIISILGYMVVAVGLAWFFELQATTTILFVRHGATEIVAGSDDPGLSAQGLLRAERLADFVQDIDVVTGVDAIYASEFMRTRQTAAAVARRLDIEIQTANPYDVETFVADVLKTHKGEIVLVVTQGDAIAPLIEELHGSKNVPQIAADEFDNFYIVTIPWFGKVKTLRLHYGEPSVNSISGTQSSAPL